MSWIDRDGNTWDRCSECRTKVPYPKTMCGPCERRIDDLLDQVVAEAKEEYEGLDP